MADGDPIKLMPGWEPRVAWLETNMQDIKAQLGRREPLIVRIDERLNAMLPHLATKTELADLRTELRAGLATLPHLATRAELADLRTELKADLATLPSKTFIVSGLAVLFTVYALGLAAVAALPTLRSFW